MSAFAAQDFWAKAQVFINRAMEEVEHRSEDERRLWAALALEMLAKWALSATSPTLVADPQRGDGEQLFKALGVYETSSHVAITATTAFKRCTKLFQPFDFDAAKGFSDARNEYLHGTEIALLRLPHDVWWERFWSLVHVLLVAHDRTPSSLVGAKRSRDVEEHLNRNQRRIEHQAKALMEAARRNLAQHKAESMTAADARRWSRVGNLSAALAYSSDVVCPVCDNYGTGESDFADESQVVWPNTYSEHDIADPYVEVTFTPDYFSCPMCHLVLDSFELVDQAGLAEQLTIETDEPVYDEPDYGND